MKKIFALLLSSVVLAIAATGCAGGGKTTANPSAVPTSAPSKKAGMILGVGGLGDQSFNDLSYDGLKKAKAELGVDYDYVEPKQVSDFELFLREMASEKSYDVIISIGFDQVDALAKVSAEFPEQKFAFIDGVVEAENVVSYVSSEQQGSFLVGALAGLMKKDAAAYKLNDKTAIGFVGALDIPLINKFYAGYEAGARYVNPAVTVAGDYTGSFDDVTIAKEICNTMYNNGADIIYHAAGGCGLGLFQSAKENGYIAIGCNSNQNIIEPDHIVASMLKRVDTAVFDIVKSVCVSDSYKGGSIVELGLADEGVGYTLEKSNITVSNDIIEKIEAIKADIISGKIVAPTEKGQVEDFLKSNKY